MYGRASGPRARTCGEAPPGPRPTLARCPADQGSGDGADQRAPKTCDRAPRNTEPLSSVLQRCRVDVKPPSRGGRQLRRSKASAQNQLGSRGALRGCAGGSRAIGLPRRHARLSLWGPGGRRGDAGGGLPLSVDADPMTYLARSAGEERHGTGPSSTPSARRFAPRRPVVDLTAGSPGRGL